MLAIGYGPDAEVVEATPGLETSRSGLIKVETEESGHTSKPGVFAAGDNVRGADLVVTAVASARRVAEAMHDFLETKRAQPPDEALKIA